MQIVRRDELGRFSTPWQLPSTNTLTMWAVGAVAVGYGVKYLYDKFGADNGTTEEESQTTEADSDVAAGTDKRSKKEA